MRYLLDTNICIALINGDDPLLTKRLLAESPSAFVLCSVVRAELEFGACNSSRVAENLERVEQFCRAFESLSFDDAAAVRYGSVRAHLKREGRPIGANDLFIAAIALSVELVLVTRNSREFKRVPGLALTTW